MVQKLKKAPLRISLSLEDTATTEYFFFFLKILAAELQNSYTSMLKLNARVASQSLEIRIHFQLKANDAEVP